MDDLCCRVCEHQAQLLIDCQKDKKFKKSCPLKKLILENEKLREIMQEKACDDYEEKSSKKVGSK